MRRQQKTRVLGRPAELYMFRSLSLCAARTVDTFNEEVQSREYIERNNFHAYFFLVFVAPNTIGAEDVAPYKRHNIADAVRV